MRRFWYVVFMIMSLMLLTLPVLAKGSASQIDISGPGLDGVVVLTDPESLEMLSMARLENFGAGSIETPFSDPSAQTYYELKRYIEVSNGRLIPWDTVRYYPHPNGDLGYIHYVGMANGSSQYDNDWFYVTPTGEAAIQQLVEQESENSLARLGNRLTAFIAAVFPEDDLTGLSLQDFSLQP